MSHKQPWDSVRNPGSAGVGFAIRGHPLRNPGNLKGLSNIHRSRSLRMKTPNKDHNQNLFFVSFVTFCSKSVSSVPAASLLRVFRGLIH
jgi:hypothetical protein